MIKTLALNLVLSGLLNYLFLLTIRNCFQFFYCFNDPVYCFLNTLSAEGNSDVSFAVIRDSGSASDSSFLKKILAKVHRAHSKGRDIWKEKVSSFRFYDLDSFDFFELWDCVFSCTPKRSNCFSNMSILEIGIQGG